MEIENITTPVEETMQEQPIAAEVVADETPEQETLPPEPEIEVPSEIAKSLDIAAFEAEYAETGELSPESYKTFEEAGIPKHIVDNYIESQQAVQAVKILDIKSTVGGEQQYSKLITWAEQNLTEQEKATYNSIVASGDSAVIKLAVSGINARRKVSEGYNPVRVIDAVETNSSGSGYESIAEMVRDVKDARYKSDPAFRAKVERKAALTNLG